MKWTAIGTLCALWPAMVFASPSIKEVDRVLGTYREAKAVQAKIDKTVNSVVGMETKSHGDFYFSKGKMRLEITEPDPSILVYDGKIVWFEARADEEHVLVTKLRAGDLRKSNSLLAALFDKKDVLNSFNLKKSDTAGGRDIFSFEAKDKKKSDVQALEIALKGKDIQRIAYRDQLDNNVTLEFSNLALGPVPASKFTYKPPKNAEITEP